MTARSAPETPPHPHRQRRRPGLSDGVTAGIVKAGKWYPRPRWSTSRRAGAHRPGAPEHPSCLGLHLNIDGRLVRRAVPTGQARRVLLHRRNSAAAASPRRAGRRAAGPGRAGVWGVRYPSTITSSSCCTPFTAASSSWRKVRRACTPTSLINDAFEQDGTRRCGPCPLQPAPSAFSPRLVRHMTPRGAPQGERGRTGGAGLFIDGFSARLWKTLFPCSGSRPVCQRTVDAPGVVDDGLRRSGGATSTASRAGRADRPRVLGRGRRKRGAGVVVSPGRSVAARPGGWPGLAPDARPHSASAEAGATAAHVSVSVEAGFKARPPSRRRHASAGPWP